MRPLRLVRIFLLGLVLASLVYLLAASKLGLGTFFPLLKNAPLQTGMKILHAHWKDFTNRYRYCHLDQRPNMSSHHWQSYVPNVDHLEQITKSLKLNLKEAWVSPPQSLFSSDDFVNTNIPPFNGRIPALVHYKSFFLAFCEARFDGINDWGNMFISMRRGRLKGNTVTWERIRLIAGIQDYRTMNPSPIVDRHNDAIVLVFSAFPTHLNFKDMLMYAGQPLSRVYVMKSYDVGVTWTDPFEITSSTIGKMDPFPVLYVPGPGHSIQMTCGRLVVPGNFFTLDKTGKGIQDVCPNCTNLSNIIYSDDGGTTWHLGAETQPSKDASGLPIHPNEAQVAELEDNVLYMNARTLNGIQPRAYCYSSDGGQTLSVVHLHASLHEPGFIKKKKKKKWKQLGAGGCQGSTVAINMEGSASVTTPLQTWLVFSNPADPLDRINLGIRLSVDGGQSWSVPWIIFPHKSGYSDLVYYEDTTHGKVERYLAILYEGGSHTVSDHINFQMFNLEALLQNLLNHTAGHQ